MGTFTPLYWPPETQNLTRWQRFLVGTPWGVSPYSVRTDISRQLCLRSAAFIEEWPNLPEIRLKLSLVSKCIEKHLEWPNVFFLPQDPCVLLFYDGAGEYRGMLCWADLNKMVEMPLYSNADYPTLTLGKLVQDIRLRGNLLGLQHDQQLHLGHEPGQRHGHGAE